MTTASTASSDGYCLDSNDSDSPVLSPSSKRRFSKEHSSRTDASIAEKLKSRDEVEAERIAGFSPARLLVRRLLAHTACDLVVGAVIVVNVILMMFEANDAAACYPAICYNPVISWFNRCFLFIYTVEASLRVFVDRERYFRDSWNILDFSIVVLGWLDAVLATLTFNAPEGMQMLPMLRILRVVRLLRAFRLLKLFPELYAMIRGFLGAMKAMFWGFLLILVLIMIWSLIIVELVHPFMPSRTDPGNPTKEYCEDAFTGVFHMALLLFQTLVAGDSWGQCLLPIILETPWTFLPFAMALVSVSLGFMNLILACIVDNAVEAHEVEREEKAEQKKQSERKAIQLWMTMAKRLDKDGNGVLSQDEMMCAFDDDTFRATMQSLGIDREDLLYMFELMDMDESGDLDYDEFIHSFLKAHEMEERVYMMMTKLQADHTARTLKRISESVTAQPAVQVQPVSPSVMALDVNSAPLDADFQRINERIQEQFNALTDVFKAAVQVSAQALPSAAVSLEANSKPFGADFELINGHIQEQFNALARSLEMNAVTLTGHTDALKAAVQGRDQLAAAPVVRQAPDQCAAASAEKPATHASRTKSSTNSEFIVDAWSQNSHQEAEANIAI